MTPDRSSVVVGILGGMGPLATADFYRKVVRATPARRDQEHLHVVVWADPSVPDRTVAVSGRGPDPTPWLRRGARHLEAMGAEIIATPCNTAHAFLPRVMSSIRARMLDMIEETAREIRHAHPTIRSIGLLASEGTVQAGLYEAKLQQAGVRVLIPDEATQRSNVTAAIRSVKAGETGPECTGLLAAAAHSLARRGAQAVIAGCTEFPLILDEAAAGLPVIDPTSILARSVVRSAGSLHPDRRAPEQKALGGSPRRRVLLSTVSSDSHTWNLVFLQLLLEEAGHEVINLGPCVPDELLLDSARREQPDAIILTTVNGHAGSDGVRAARAIKESSATRHIPLMIGGKLGISEGSSENGARELLQAGFDVVFDDNSEPGRLTRMLAQLPSRTALHDAA
jgi:aspartate racemase